MTIHETVTVDLDWQDASGWDGLPPDAEARLGEVIRATIARAGLTGSFQVSMIVTTDRAIRRINRRYRGIDKATDVLSFPQSDAPLLSLPHDQAWVAHPFGDDTHYAAPPPDHLPTVGSEGETTKPDEHADPRDPSAARSPLSTRQNGERARVGPSASHHIHLGDIMISTETVARQAREAGHSAWWELCFLTAHGTLHLLGYDDYYLPGYQAMVAIQEAVLTDLGITRERNEA